ncbi:hypothetical protein ACFY2T_06765 [Streptomyces sp. NPDC001260]|uniref:hypothetical protein n=1 Tax=Streptomyces sp. NPDC001260 TaxID=3364551 RepID=UPI0036754F01
MSIVGAAHKFRFVAEAGEFNAAQCVFYLDPVSAEGRATPDPRVTWQHRPAGTGVSCPVGVAEAEG